MKRIFITGIGTDVGKTVAASVVCCAGKADYWKPVQAGGLDCTDTDMVKKLTRGMHVKCHPESFKLALAVSPHAAAAAEGLEITVRDCLPPATSGPLVIEGAGGMMAPLNKKELMIDLAMHLKAGMLLVVKNYLGSINHTLLSLDALRSRNIQLLGLVFCGKSEPDSENVIAEYSGVSDIWRIPFTDQLTPRFISETAKDFTSLWT